MYVFNFIVSSTNIYVYECQTNEEQLKRFIQDSLVFTIEEH